VSFVRQHMIILEGVGVSFNKSEPLLSNINLAVRRGEVFVVLGSSGSGKSVLFRVISGLTPLNSGRVLIDGEEFSAKIRKKIGLLFQKNALFDSMTVRENLEFPLVEAGEKSTAKINERVTSLLTAVGLKESQNLYPSEISGGMQRRLGIARALVLNPPIILYDDPTAGLDPVTSKIIVELILKLKKENGTTVVAITNDINRAFQLGDRVGFIMNKTLVVSGSPQETKHIQNNDIQKFIRGQI
jgi:phospholipid/cholesterol/gamma-HCH transport system ATP-binding protein